MDVPRNLVCEEHLGVGGTEPKLRLPVSKEEEGFQDVTSEAKAVKVKYDKDKCLLALEIW